MHEINLELLQKFDVAVPRYTSYPTAPEWGSLQEEAYKNHLITVGQQTEPLSLYFHIPFCKTMCLYCACSVVLNRKPENEERYVTYLLKEIAMVAQLVGKKRVCQVHFGGGTPTKLSEELLFKLINALHEYFLFDTAAEVAIEIDPRTVFEDDGKKLKALKSMGFNRISFGVQDTNQQVQEAVRRRQSYEMTETTFLLARQLGFRGINIDLIYGLPYQTVETFSDTVEAISSLNPDRVALFSYARVPWLKQHQRAIKEETLPTTEEKFRIYLMARAHFVKFGYEVIGMDHFAKKEDELAHAFAVKTLHRNFQGYTVIPTKTLIAFGITAIGYGHSGYFQNVKELSQYYESLDQGRAPVFRGLLFTQEDHLRRWVIERLMCDFCISKEECSALFSISFDTHFLQEQKRLVFFEKEGLVQNFPEKIIVTKRGEPFVRNIASAFDAYLHQEGGKNSFSKAI